MGFAYEDHATTDQMVTAFCSNAFNSAGATGYVIAPFRGHLMECGFIPTVSVTSTTTLQVALSSAAVSATSFTVIVASGNASFASTVLPKGGVASVTLDATVVPRGSALELTTSGGDSATKGATVYAIFRRANSQ